MPPDVRELSEDEFDEFAAVLSQAFGFAPREDEKERWKRDVEFDRSLGAFEDGRLIGTAAAVSFDLTVPGGTIPTAGVTMVAVLPTHSRRGVLREIMRRQLGSVIDRGEPTASLWASESLIYGRFGYGIAATNTVWELEPSHFRIAYSSAPKGRVRLTDVEEARKLLPALYDELRKSRPGFLTWSENRWEWTWSDPEHRREGGSPKRFVVYEEGGDVLGSAVYRTKPAWADGHPTGSVDVRLLLAATLDAYEALWSHCFGIDLVTGVTAHFRPVDEPLMWMLADPRRLRGRRADGLWIRMTDVAKALEGRTYGIEGRLVLDVHDGFLGHGGRFALEGGPEGAVCTPTGERPDLTLDVQALGAVYLGADHLRGLAQAGRISGDPAPIRLADAMFRGEREPWCPTLF